MANVRLDETENRRRLHIGSYFTDLNESEYQDLVRIFSAESQPLNAGEQDELKIWDDLFGILAWKFQPTKSGDMSIDAEKVFNELKRMGYSITKNK